MVSSPHLPKYQAIHAVLRERILGGELEAGAKLPPQSEMADEFGVTLMTMRQAISSLESDGLVWAARGRGTFVADRPVDISLSNLSSFAQQMQAAGVELTTEVLAVEDVSADSELERTRAALGNVGPIVRVLRRRSNAGVPFALQRSYLAAATAVEVRDDTSLYVAIEAAAGWVIAEAQESITAVALHASDAEVLDAPAGEPALLSLRTSINQFGAPFLYDEAVLVGARTAIAANRTSSRLSLDYGIASKL